jgi:hypothetical protein
MAAVAGWLGACGGGGDDASVRALVDDAFKRPIPTAIVTVDLEVRIEGIDELRDPLRLQLTGPYRSGADNRIPAFDWDVSFAGGGQTIAGGLLSTSENVFVNFQGTDYEIGEEAIGSLNAELAEAAQEGEGQSLAQFGIDPSNWLEEADEEGEETVAGVKTTHVRAQVDVAKMLDDLNALVGRAGAAVPGSGPAPTLDEEQQRRIEEVLGEPTLDVYVGVDDKVVRRLSADLELDVPEGSRERLGGIERGTIAFSIEFARVGEPVEIAAPGSARPIEELTRQLGVLRGGDGFDRYTECLEQADPSRIGEIQACSDLLQ